MIDKSPAIDSIIALLVTAPCLEVIATSLGAKIIPALCSMLFFANKLALSFLENILPELDIEPSWLVKTTES